MRSTLFRALLHFSVLVVMACGARTELDLAAPDDSPDAEIDADLPDARVIAPRPDGSADATLPMPCRADRECRGGGRCVADVPFLGEDLAPVPLVCGSGLGGSSDGSFCREAADCDRGLCVVAGTCVPPCADDVDCAEGSRCGTVLARTAALALQPYDGCVALHDAPEGVVALVETRRDALRARPRDLDLRRVDTRGPTTWVVAASPDVRVESRLFVDPEGVVLFDPDAVLPGSPPPVNPVVPVGGPLTVLLPNSRRAVPDALEYVLTASADRNSDALVAAFGTDGAARRALDVDIYYVGGMDLRPSGERGPRAVAEGLREAERTLGVTIGSVRQHEVVGTTRARFAVLEETRDGGLPELAELFRLSAGAGRPSIDIFFVRQAGNALGVSGGVPGPAPMHGTDGSGIAIAADLLGSPDAPPLGRVLAHEIGHHLGLFHTTEALGFVLDPLVDTPECPLDRDVSGDGVLSEEECVDSGADNLMFWAASGDDLSRDQTFVVRRSPVLR